MAVRSHSEAARGIIVVSRAEAHTAILALGRLLFGGFFIFSSLDHFLNLRTLAGYAGARGVPAPEVAVFGSGLLLLFGGLSILTAKVPRAGAAAIALFLVGVTPVMHAFWNDPTAAERAADIGNFTKNIALLGATCFVAALPTPWPTWLGHESMRAESR